MARDSRKHQKQKERRNAKRKVKRQDMVRRESLGIAERLRRMSAAPVLHCFVHKEIWDAGIGNVLLSRELLNGNVAFGSFLVDLYCLGVKDAYADILPRSRYDERIYGRLISSAVKIEPPCARKLVEGAVAYAHDLGLTPHPDYRKAAPIFGDIDAGECAERFQYGMDDGKPHFVVGPRDSPERCAQILNILRNRFGEDGFHYTIPVGGPSGVNDMLDYQQAFLAEADDEE